MMYSFTCYLLKCSLTSIAVVPAVRHFGIAFFHLRLQLTNVDSYICGQRWKTCPCDRQNGDRLIARANQVVARNPPRAGVVREQ